MSTVYLCVQCWSINKESDILAQCPACVVDASSSQADDWTMAPGDGQLRPLKDFKQPKYYDASPDPKCPDHQDAALEYFCGVCKSELYEPLDDRDDARVLGVAGHVAAGKTMYLMTSVHKLNAAAGEEKTVTLFPIGKASAEFQANSSDFLDNGVKPAQTQVPAQSSKEEKSPNNLCWTIYEEGREKEPTRLLAVFDLGGEVWRRNGKVDDKIGSFQRYLGLVKGMIFLIDGAAVAADLGLPVSDAWAAERHEENHRNADTECFEILTHRLGPRTDAIAMALVISKCDLIWENSDWEALHPDNGTASDAEREQIIKDILRRTGRKPILDHSMNRFVSTSLHAVSSLGFRPQVDDLDGDNRLIRHPQPIGVTEPLLKLVDRRDGGFH